MWYIYTHIYVIFTLYAGDDMDIVYSIFSWLQLLSHSFTFFVLQVMRKTHYYLIDTSVVTVGAAVSKLQFHIIEEHPFVVQGLNVWIC